MNNNWINYHHLNYFRVIANEGSISSASKILKIGQPTLSAQLKQFEDTIGIPLFEHKHKKLILTEEGKLALEYANEIFKLGDELLEVLHDKLLSNSTHIQIGALDSVPKNVILSIIKFAVQKNNCKITILEGDGEELLDQMANHKIDLLVANHIPRLNTEIKLYSKSIAKLPLSIYGTKDFSKLKNNYPASLKSTPFILPTRHSKLRHDFDHFIKDLGIEVETIIETQDLELQKTLGLEGMGLIPLNQITAAPYIKDKKLFEIGKIPNIYEEIFLLSHSRKIENPVSADIMKNFKL